jgi:hypothetical protein
MMEKRSTLWQRKPSGVRESQRLRAALSLAQRRIRELVEERDEARREVADLRRALAAHAQQMTELTTKVALVTSREQELRAMLLGAHYQLMRRAEKIKTELAVELLRAAPQQDAASEAHSVSQIPAALRLAEQNLDLDASAGYEPLSKNFAYRRLVGRIREMANVVVPPEATVAVVSKGDEDLLELGAGRRGWHFPQNEEGVYAGYYPADSTEAIAHLEELREKGAEFLLFPETSFWWLESYRGFGEHLDTRYRRVWADQTFVIYKLSEAHPPKGGGAP